MCWIQDIIRRWITINEQENYQKIGQLLINAGPEDAKKIIARTELFPEGDGCKYEFYYVDFSGKLDWPDPDGRAMRDLTKLLTVIHARYLGGN
ncbi:hypothetical protein D4100_19230 [Serratia inhibens]|uniref:Uncharacterized protein n=1 Tax=Serratia inhibens TaxID=2338073 RepID=A0AA93BVB3_9GAMM|nr:hypothetical protein D4100_19230 [Serratia inhibens]